jgi:hypothetical protein
MPSMSTASAADRALIPTYLHAVDFKKYKNNILIN